MGNKKEKIILTDGTLVFEAPAIFSQSDLDMVKDKLQNLADKVEVFKQNYDQYKGHSVEIQLENGKFFNLYVPYLIYDTDIQKIEGVLKRYIQ